MAELCNKNTACISHEKNMSVIVDTCIIGNIMRAVMLIMQNFDHKKHEEFELFCFLIKEYLKRMNLCPLNHRLLTTTNIFSNEMDLGKEECALYNIEGLSSICEEESYNYLTIKKIIESYVIYKNKSIPKIEIDNFRLSMKSHYERIKEISDNDISLILLALGTQNKNGCLVLTDDIKVLDLIETLRLNRNYKSTNGIIDSQNIFGLTSLTYFGNVFFCCELYRSYYVPLFEIRKEHVDKIIRLKPSPNSIYESEISSAKRIISSANKVY